MEGWERPTNLSRLFYLTPDSSRKVVRNKLKIIVRIYVKILGEIELSLLSQRETSI